MDEFLEDTLRLSKFFQSLTKDVGCQALRGQLQQVIVLMKISANWKQFERNFARAFEIGQQELDLDE